MEDNEIQWFYGGNGEAVPSGEAVASTADKLPYYTPIKVTKDMDENQKAFFTKYNDMQKKLIEHGLMESK